MKTIGMRLKLMAVAASAALVGTMAAQALDLGNETKTVAFGTNGVAVIGIPMSRSSAALLSLNLSGITSITNTQTATALLVTGGIVTQGSYSITIQNGAGTFTNFTAADVGGPGDAIYVSLATSNLVTSSGVATNFSKIPVFDTQSTNGLGYDLQTVSTNLFGYTNVSTRLRATWHGYSQNLP